MIEFSKLYDLACARKGGEAELKQLLPKPKSKAALKKITDDRYLATMTEYIFKAGFVWRVIDSKWDDFETVFSGFVPAYWAQVPDEVLEGLAKDARIVRNMQKIKTVRDNALMIVDVQKSSGSFSQFIAEYPMHEQIHLFEFLKKQGSRLGGNSATYFLRSLGVDVFIFSNDVVTALIREGVIDKAPTSKKLKQQAQDAFNIWHEESGLSYSQLSRVLAMTVDS